MYTFQNLTDDFQIFPSPAPKDGEFARPIEAPPHGEVRISDEFLASLTDGQRETVKERCNPSRPNGQIWKLIRDPEPDEEPTKGRKGRK